MNNNTMLVDSVKSFKDLLVDCNNNRVNDSVIEKQFPVTAEDGGEWEYSLWDPKGSVSPEDAIERMKGDDEDNPWLPGRAAHLLVFGAKNPDAQRVNSIVALGSAAEVSGDHYVPCLYGDVSERGLRLRRWNYVWSSYYRFLRVRKVVKKS